MNKTHTPQAGQGPRIKVYLNYVGFTLRILTATCPGDFHVRKMGLFFLPFQITGVT